MLCTVLGKGKSNRSTWVKVNQLHSGAGGGDSKHLPNCERNRAVRTLKRIILDVWNSAAAESWDYMLPLFVCFWDRLHSWGWPSTPDHFASVSKHWDDRPGWSYSVFAMLGLEPWEVCMPGMLRTERHTGHHTLFLMMACCHMPVLMVGMSENFEKEQVQV